MEEQKVKASKFPGFPYNPYSIQIDFMNALYQSLNNGGVSMLESPTGKIKRKKPAKMLFHSLIFLYTYLQLHLF